MLRSRVLATALYFGVISFFAAACAIPGPENGTPLTVKNYLSWCSVSVNGDAASTAGAQTIKVIPGAIPLSASPVTGFELGVTPWHGTDGDTGSGDPGTRTGGQATTSVTVGSSSVCVWVCCETHGTTDCPTANQCP